MLQRTFYPAMACIKASVLVWYMSLFAIRTFNVLAWIEIAAAILWAVACSVESVMQCHPASYSWDKTAPGGYCGDLFPGELACAVSDVAADVLILLLPTCMLSRLRLSRGRRFAVVGVFLLGGM